MGQQENNYKEPRNVNVNFAVTETLVQLDLTPAVISGQSPTEHAKRTVVVILCDAMRQKFYTE